MRMTLTDAQQQETSIRADPAAPMGDAARRCQGDPAGLGFDGNAGAEGAEEVGGVVVE
jgi:hypothetical protein